MKKTLPINEDTKNSTLKPEIADNLTLPVNKFL